MNLIQIESEFIKLDQLLKFSTVVDSGGVAKLLIQEECVLVNGEVCTQRGRKIYPDDVVDIEFFDDEGLVEEVITLKVTK
jgi:ribosome-associated protein